MSIARNALCTKDTWLVAPGSGNGKGDFLEVGETGQANRFVAEYDMDYTGALGVSSAVWTGVATSGCFASMGNAPKFYLERVTGSYGAEGDIGGNCSYNTSNATKYPGPAVATFNRGFFAGTPPEGKRISVTLSALVEAHRVSILPATKGKLVLRGIAADAAGTGWDESNAARYIAIKSRHTGAAHRIEMVLDDNRPPGAPTVTVLNVTGTTAESRLVGSDPDAPNDAIYGSITEWYSEDATDDENGNILTGTKIRAQGGHQAHAGTSMTVVRTDYNFLPGEIGRVRAQTRDKRSLWSPFSRLGDAIRFNTPPRALKNLTVTTDSTTPDYGGTLDDPDPGAQFGGVEAQVRRVTAQGTTMFWNATTEQPGDDGTTVSGTGMVPVAGGTQFLVTHAGEQLSFGQEYEVRARPVDQYGGRGPFLAWRKFTPRELDVPIVIPAAGVRQDTLTPPLGASYSQSFDGIRIRVYRSLTGTDLLWNIEQTVPAATAATLVYGSVGTATALAWAQRIFVETETRVVSSGTWSPVSDRVEVRINALSRGVKTQASGSIVSLRDGRLVVTTTTPSLLLPRDDPDEPGDAATRRVVEVWAHPRGSAPVHVSDITQDITDRYDVPAGVWAWEQDREVRHAYADQSRVLGRWGEFVVIGASQPPTLTAGAPIPDPSGDPTQTISYVYTSPSGKAQARGEFPIWLALAGDEPGQEIHRGIVTTPVASGSVSSYTVPVGVLQNATRYMTIPRAYDADGLYGELAGKLIAAVSFRAGAGLMRIGAEIRQQLPADTFTRTATNAWGTANVGGAWTLTGPAADFAVTGSQGTISTPVVNSARIAELAAVSIRDGTFLFRVKSDKLAAGSSQETQLAVRRVDPTNRYLVALTFTTAAGVALTTRKIVGGTQTSLHSVASSLTHVAGSFYWVKFQVTGANPTTLRARAWLDGTGEPTTWLNDTTDSTAILQAPGAISLTAQLLTGTTNAPVLFTFDDLSTT